MEPRAVENKVLSQAPSFAADHLLDARCYKAWAAYLKDQDPFRPLALEANALISIYIFAVSPNPDVVIGRKGLWFYEQDLTRGCVFKMPPEQLAESVAAWADQLRASGRRLLLVVAPDKAMIYPQDLPSDALQRHDCTAKKEAGLRQELAKRLDPDLIDLTGEIKALADRSDDLVFYKDDTHWLPEVSLALPRDIVMGLKPGLWDESDVAVLSKEAMTPDLAFMVGLEREAFRTDYFTRRPGVEVDKIKDASPILLKPSRSRSLDVPLIEARAIFIGDSFSRETIDVLRPYFREFAQVNWESIGTTEFDQVMRDTDIVIVESVMRNLFERIEVHFNAKNLAGW